MIRRLLLRYVLGIRPAPKPRPPSARLWAEVVANAQEITRLQIAHAERQIAEITRLLADTGKDRVTFHLVNDETTDERPDQDHR